MQIYGGTKSNRPLQNVVLSRLDNDVGYDKGVSHGHGPVIEVTEVIGSTRKKPSSQCRCFSVLQVFLNLSRSLLLKKTRHKRKRSQRLCTHLYKRKHARPTFMNTYEKLGRYILRVHTYPYQRTHTIPL